MATHSVEQHLGLKVEDYDREIRRLVPHYDELVSEGIELLSSLVPANACVIDLGCGTGRLSAAILTAMPSAKVIALDIDPRMLDEAKKRLSPEANASSDARVSFVLGSFYDPIPACDAVVACLSLHHVHDAEAKVTIYRAIHDALPPGAPFLNLDASVSGDGALAERTMGRWASVMGTHGIDATAAAKHFDDWSRDERYASLHEELTSLARAGFAEPECFWRKGPMALYGGRRPGQPTHAPSRPR